MPNSTRSHRLDPGMKAFAWDMIRAGAVMVLGIWAMHWSADVLWQHES